MYKCSSLNQKVSCQSAHMSVQHNPIFYRNKA